MSGPFGAGALNFFSGAAEFYPHTIDQSVRFNDNDSAYLEKTFSGTGNRRTFTISFWFKRCRTGTAEYIFAGGNDVSNRFHMDINASGTFQIEAKSGGSTQIKMEGGPVLRDVGAWYHFVLRVDTTQSTASDRVRLYVNGGLLTFNSNTYPSQNADLNWNLNDQVRIGRAGWATNYFDGYFAEFINVDGSSLAPTSFGETKAGIWIPKDYTGSYGTNGFKLAFQDSSALGDDTSGNGHDFTSSGLAANDQMPDSPTNNFATLNPLDAGSNVTLSNGNLVFASSAADGGCRSTINFAGDKYYVEAIVGTYANAFSFGIANKNRSLSADAGEDLNDFYGWYINPSQNWFADGTNPWNTGSNSNSGSLDVMQMFVDASDPDSIKLFAGINNTYYDSSGGTTANPSTGANPTATITGGEEWAIGLWNRNSASSNIVVNFGQDSSFAGNKTAAGNTDANGIGDFFYSVPTNGKALCAANLPAPGIDPAADKTPTDYFNTVLYSGNSTARSITGVGFQPDFTWIKQRATIARRHHLQDSVRGAGKSLFSNDTTAEESSANYLTSFDSDGFSLGSSSETNGNTHTYVAWNWKAGGTAVSNTDGSITSSVSASPDSGFSIVTYTGTSNSNATVGHGLGVAPTMVIVKPRTEARNWLIWHTAFNDNDKALLFDDDVPADNRFGPNAPTASVFGAYGGQGNRTGTDFVAYCFTDIDGMVKAGSYVGNGSSDGPMVFTGFRPAFVMFKNTTTAGGHWVIYDAVRDTFNAVDSWLNPNRSNAEGTNSAFDVDFVSNGFKVRNTDIAWNTSGDTFIYLAFAEQPFKYANAR